MPGSFEHPDAAAARARQAKAEEIYFRLLAERAEEALKRSGYIRAERERSGQSPSVETLQPTVLQPTIVWFRAAPDPEG